MSGGAAGGGYSQVIPMEDVRFSPVLVKFINFNHHFKYEDAVRFTLPFKDQCSTNAVRRQLRDLSAKLHTTIQPVFVSKKISEDLRMCEKKAKIVNQQCVVYMFECDQCDAEIPFMTVFIYLLHFLVKYGSEVCCNNVN